MSPVSSSLAALRGAAAGVLVAVALVSPSSALADSDDARRASEHADMIASSWASQMTDSGLLADPVTGQPIVGYGQVMLGHGMIWAAYRNGDDSLRAAGERVVITTMRGTPDAFATWTYAQLELDAGANPGLISDATRQQLRGWLAQIGAPYVGERAHRCQVSTSCYSNLYLMDAVATLAMLQTDVPGVAGKLADREGSRAYALKVINDVIPNVINTKGRIDGQPGSALLSDPSRNPTVYHGLSVAALGDAVQRAGLGPGTPAYSALAATARMLPALADPDGNLSYMGRGQGQVWQYGASLYAATLAPPAQTATMAPFIDAQLSAVDERIDVAEVGVPLLDGARRSDYKGTDSYASQVTYNGLLVFTLNRAAAQMLHLPGIRTFAGRGRGSLLAARRPLRVSDPASGVHVMADGRTWMAVHDRAGHPTDLRYDFGLLSAKTNVDGAYEPVLYPRPKTESDVRGAGPFVAGGELRVNDTDVTSDGVVLHASARRSGDTIRRGLRVSYVPVRRGVRMRVCGARDDDRVETRWFYPASMKASESGRTVRAGKLSLSAGQPVDFQRPAAVLHGAEFRDMRVVVAYTRADRHGCAQFTYSR